MRTFVETEKGKVFFSNFNRAMKYAKKHSIAQIFCTVESYLHTSYVEHKTIKSFYALKTFTYSV